MIVKTGCGTDGSFYSTNLYPRWQHRCRLHMRMFKPKKEPLNTTEKVLELLQPVRYKPTSVDEMAEVRETYFAIQLITHS